MLDFFCIGKNFGLIGIINLIVKISFSFQRFINDERNITLGFMVFEGVFVVGEILGFCGQVVFQIREDMSEDGKSIFFCIISEFVFQKVRVVKEDYGDLIYWKGCNKEM